VKRPKRPRKAHRKMKPAKRSASPRKLPVPKRLKLPKMAKPRKPPNPRKLPKPSRIAGRPKSRGTSKLRKSAGSKTKKATGIGPLRARILKQLSGAFTGTKKRKVRRAARPKPKHIVAVRQARTVSRPPRIDDRRIQVALRELREGKSLAEIARNIDVSRERLTRRLDSMGVVRRKGNRRSVRKNWPRSVIVYSASRTLMVTVGSFARASKAGKYLSAVRQFVTTGDRNHLDPYIGEFITDINGRTYPFETDPNTLYSLSLAGTETFEQVYRIAV